MMVGYFEKMSEFVTYTLLIYACYITSGVYHEKILKHKYKNIIDGEHEQFQAPIIFTLFPPLVASIIGLTILHFKNERKQDGLQIPLKKSLICSTIITLNMWTYNKAIVFSSFSASVMVKSCSLLSVILVGVFCSRVKDKNLKLGVTRVWIGVVACIGIIIFNLFKKTEQSSDKPLTIIGIVFLAASLLGDGFLPDFQAEIKSLYKPTSIEMYYQINISTMLIALAYGAISFELVYIFEFLSSHEQILGDIAIFSILNSIGQLVIYQMIKLFKQHVPPFIIATRKCFTVVVNIIYFGHSVNFLQILGILFVFFAVMMEVYQNYRQKQVKIKESNTISQIQIQDDKLVKHSYPQSQSSQEQQTK